MLSRFTAKILANSLLAGTTVLFLGALFIASYHSDIVKKIGKHWVAHYAQSMKQEAISALSQAKKTSQTSPLTTLLEKPRWDEVLLGDRAYRLKRKMLARLCLNLQQQGDYKRLIKWSDVWLSMNDRDLDAIAFYYEALYRSKDKQSEGFNGLKTEWHRFPESSTLARFYYMALKERGIHDPTFEELHQKFIEQEQQNVLKSAREWKVRFYSGIPTTPVTDREYEDYVDAHDNLKETWALISDYLRGEALGQYSAKHGLTPGQQAEYWIKKGAKTKKLFGRLHFAANPQTTLVSKPLRLNLVTNTNNWSRLSLTLGPDTETLRIDLPPKIRLQIDKVRIRTKTMAQSVPLSQIESKNMAIVNSSLTTISNSDRYFFLPINDYLPHIRNEQDMSIELVIQVSTKVGTIALAEFSTSPEN